MIEAWVFEEWSESKLAEARTAAKVYYDFVHLVSKASLHLAPGRLEDLQQGRSLTSVAEEELRDRSIVLFEDHDDDDDDEDDDDHDHDHGVATWCLSCWQ